MQSSRAEFAEGNSCLLIITSDEHALPASSLCAHLLQLGAHGQLVNQTEQILLVS